MIDYKTYDEQIEILKIRGLFISDEKIAKELLKQNNYYNLINGYKDIFIQRGITPETFINGVSFDEIYSLHQFDKELRLNLSHILIIIERAISSILAHEFSRSFPNHNMDYLDINNYNEERYPIQTSQLVTKLNNLLIDAIDHNESMICHYKTKYNQIPLWVFINKISFGTVAKMYQYLLPRERAAIAKSISEISKLTLYPNDIQEAVNVLVLLRNKCAHDQKVYDFNTLPMTIRSNEFIRKNLPSVHNVHSLFGAIGCLSLFVAPDVFKKFVSNIKSQIKRLFIQIHSIPTQIILDKMGVPQSFLL